MCEGRWQPGHLRVERHCAFCASNALGCCTVVHKPSASLLLLPMAPVHMFLCHRVAKNKEILVRACVGIYALIRDFYALIRHFVILVAHWFKRHAFNPENSGDWSRCAATAGLGYADCHPAIIGGFRICRADAARAAYACWFVFFPLSRPRMWLTAYPAVCAAPRKRGVKWDVGKATE